MHQSAKYLCPSSREDPDDSKTPTTWKVWMFFDQVMAIWRKKSFPKIKWYKFALLWGEAQLGLPYVCLEKKIAYGYPKKVTYSDPKVTHIDPTHLPLPPHTSPDPDQAITWFKIIQTLQVGGVLESSGSPLADGHRNFEELMHPKPSYSRKTTVQFLMNPTVC